MKITAESMNAYLFLLCGLCTEIKRDELLKGLGTVTFARRTLRAALDGGMLCEKKTPLGKTVGLSHKGYTALSEVADLRWHYDLMSNARTMRYDSASLARRLEKSRVLFSSVMAGLPVNGITYEYERKRGRKHSGRKSRAVSGLYTSGKPLTKEAKPYETLLSENPPDVASLYTAALIKRYEVLTGRFAPTLRINQSRARGHIIGPGTNYACYCMNGQPEKLVTSVEEKLSGYLSGIYMRCYGAEEAGLLRRVSPSGDALLFCTRKDAVLSLARKPGERRKKSSICDIYSRVFIIPPQKRIDRMCMQNWQKNLKDSLYLPEEIKRAEGSGFDAYVEGRYSLELVSMDLCRIERALEIKDQGVRLHVLCSEDDKSVLEELFYGGDVLFEEVEK